MASEAGASTTRWTIRIAHEDDAENLARCIDAAYRIHRTRIADLPAVSDGLEEEIRTNHVWVAECDNRIVGGLVLALDSGHTHLTNVAVDPEFAGQGLARALMEHAERKSKDLGFGEIRLATHVEMPGNVRLYERLGWKETSRSGSKVHMAKIL